MSRHICHLPGCQRACPPAHLFCRSHWAMVPADLQAEVYRTVKLRDKNHANATWAPWWRAQAQATVAVLHKVHPGDPGIEKYEARQMASADRLEAMGST